MRLGDRLDGHMVQGHVDGVGRVRATRGEGESTILEIAPPAGLLRYIVEKGSIAVDGVSLTVAERLPDALHGRPDPAHDGDHHPGAGRARSRGQPRGGRAGKIRGVVGGALRAAPGGTRMTSSAVQFATVAEAIEEIRAGHMVVILDSEERENEGDLVMAAQFATPEAVNFMATHGRGLICLALTEDRCDQLGLKPMVRRNEAPHATAFTEAIEARHGHHDGHLGPGPLAHDHGGDRSRGGAGGPREARARLPAAGQAGRRAGARGAHRGGGRPGPARRPHPGGRDLRDQQLRRHDGARPRPDPATPPSTA